MLKPNYIIELHFGVPLYTYKTLKSKRILLSELIDIRAPLSRGMSIVPKSINFAELSFTTGDIKAVNI